MTYLFTVDILGILYSKRIPQESNYDLSFFFEKKKLNFVELFLFFRGADIISIDCVNYALSIEFTGEKTVYIVHAYT